MATKWNPEIPRPELSGDAKEVLRQARELDALLGTKGWKVYLEILDKQAEAWANLALNPIESLLEMPKGEYAKGVLFGLQLARSIPAATVAEKKDILSSLHAQGVPVGGPPEED